MSSRAPARSRYSRSRSRSPRYSRRYSRSRSRSGSPPRGSGRGSYRGRSHRYLFDLATACNTWRLALHTSLSRSPMSSRRRHVGSREDPTPSTCLGVFGLSLYTTERELEKEFSKFGQLEKVTVVLDGKVTWYPKWQSNIWPWKWKFCHFFQTGRSRGFAFVYYAHSEDAKAAKETLNDQVNGLIKCLYPTFVSMFFEPYFSSSGNRWSSHSSWLLHYKAGSHSNAGGLHGTAYLVNRHVLACHLV